MCIVVFVFMVCLSVVVCHHIVLCSTTDTHHEHQHHTAQENRYKPLDSHFQDETDISDGSKVEEHPRFFIYSREREKEKRDRDRDRRH